MTKNRRFHVIIATGFGSGFCPIGPGTAGALLATLLWLGGSYLVSASWLVGCTAVAIVLFTWLGVLSADAMEAEWGEDPSQVVVDEMVGVWIPLLVATPQNWLHAGLAFVLFRFFDILKPLGIRKMEAIKGGWGVMLDDVLAGIYSLVVLALVIHFCNL